MITAWNHAERDGYCYQVAITLRVMITAWNHAERDDYYLKSRGARWLLMVTVS